MLGVEQIERAPGQCVAFTWEERSWTGPCLQLDSASSFWLSETIAEEEGRGPKHETHRGLFPLWSERPHGSLPLGPWHPALHQAPGGYSENACQGRE